MHAKYEKNLFFLLTTEHKFSIFLEKFHKLYKNLQKRLASTKLIFWFRCKTLGINHLKSSSWFVNEKFDLFLAIISRVVCVEYWPKVYKYTTIAVCSWILRIQQTFTYFLIYYCNLFNFSDIKRKVKELFKFKHHRQFFVKKFFWPHGSKELCSKFTGVGPTHRSTHPHISPPLSKC